MNIEEQRQFNDFVRRSFRDCADQDYIMARAAYKMSCDLQFLWLATQAIEKYLKAILIYNKYSAKDLMHDVRKIYKQVQEIADIHFDFPSKIQEFIDYLGVYGQDRYFEQAYDLRLYALDDLDQAVWFIRRYCQPLRCREESGDSSVHSLAGKIAEIQSIETFDRPAKFAIIGGILETVRSDKNHPSRIALLWQNSYFSRKQTARTRRSSQAWPQINHTPEMFLELDKYVRFSKTVRDHYLPKGK